MSLIDSLAEEAAKAAIEDLTKFGKDYGLVRDSAEKFLQAYDKYQKEELIGSLSTDTIIGQIIQTQQKTISQLKSNQLNQKEIEKAYERLELVKKQLSQNSSAFGIRIVYLLAFKFQESYKHYYNLLPTKVQYVSNTGDVHETSWQWLALTATSKGRVSSLLGKNSVYTSDIAVDEEKKVEYLNLINKMMVFFQSIENKLSEGRSNEQLKNAPYFYYSESKNRVLPTKRKAILKTGNDTYSSILNAGEIGEGYVYALQFSSSIIEGIAKVDSTSSFLHEDIFDEDLGINIAVKTKRAALPGLQPYKDLASEVINQKDKEVTLEEAKKIIKEGKPRNLVGLTLNKIIEQTGIQADLMPYGIDFREFIENLE